MPTVGSAVQCRRRAPRRKRRAPGFPPRIRQFCDNAGAGRGHAGIGLTKFFTEDAGAPPNGRVAVAERIVPARIVGGNRRHRNGFPHSASTATGWWAEA